MYTSRIFTTTQSIITVFFVTLSVNAVYAIPRHILTKVFLHK